MKGLKNGFFSCTALFFLGACAFWRVASVNGYASETDLAEKYRILCDAFSVPGMLLIMISALVFLSNKGAFDVIIYGVRRLLGAVFPIGMTDDFYEYKRGKRRGGAPIYPLLVGTLFMLPAVILLVALSGVFT